MDTFLTTEQVAQRLKVHQNTVIGYIRNGKLAASRVGNVYRIKESAIAAFLGEPAPARSETSRIIAVANQKGGVAKTTTAVNITSCLAAARKRVLLVDLDPQGGCAVCLGMDTSLLKQTVYNLLLDRTINADKVIMETNFGFDLLPSNIDLAGAEVELKQVLSQESVLKRRLQAIEDRYDYIIIDTPPSLGILTVNALTAADSMLIPIACEYMALRGLKMLLDTVDNVQAVTNPNLKILGVLATKYDGRTLNSREVYDFLKDFCKRSSIRLFDEVIKQSVRFTEAPNLGKPLVQLHPELDGAQAYLQVTEEIING